MLAPIASRPVPPDAHTPSSGISRTHSRPSRRQVWRALGIVVLVLAVLLTVFGAPLVQLIGTAALLISLAVTLVIGITLLLAVGVLAITPESRPRAQAPLRRLGHTSSILALLLVSLVVAALGSQLHTSTAPIMGSNGQVLPGSISTLEQVTLNGSQQWITVRGKDSHAPVLLFLMGGPGAGGLADQSFLNPLEDHFVVVNWDQPGTGKSYGAVPTATLTPQRFVSDAHALVLQLRARFHQEKIYVLGSSWGSILGIQLVQHYPDLFYAYVGHGQMVNTTENDVMGYNFALDYARQHHETGAVDAMMRNGPPPYTGDGMVWKYADYMNVLQEYMGLPSLTLGVPLLPWFASEYGLVDRANYVRGFFETFAQVYPQLRDLDFTTQAATLGVPVYFLAGRMDVNAMASLTERYYALVQAPHKELIWFTSGHSMNDSDTAQFVDVMVNHVLVQTRS